MSGPATSRQRAAIPNEPSPTLPTRQGDLKPYPLPKESDQDPTTGPDNTREKP